MYAKHGVRKPRSVRCRGREGERNLKQTFMPMSVDFDKIVTAVQSGRSPMHVEPRSNWMPTYKRENLDFYFTHHSRIKARSSYLSDPVIKQSQVSDGRQRLFISIPSLRPRLSCLEIQGSRHPKHLVTVCWQAGESNGSMLASVCRLQDPLLREWRHPQWAGHPTSTSKINIIPHRQVQAHLPGESTVCQNDDASNHTIL